MALDLTGIDYANASAVDIIKSILAPYGLGTGDLAQRMYDVGKTTGDANATYLWLREQKEYKAAFPGMDERAKKGLAPINEETYNQWKSTYTSVMRNNGIPSNFYDSPDDFAMFIGNDVSPQEVETRVLKGVVAAQQAPQEVKDALLNYYGIDEGHLAAYWLDPNAKGKDLLRQQAATYLGGAAKRGGFDALSRAEAESLSDYNVNPDQALQAFGNLSYGKELLNALPGEEMRAMTRDEQLEYVKGTPAAQQELAQRAAKRKAQFAGGGGFAESGQGVVGLASET